MAKFIRFLLCLSLLCIWIINTAWAEDSLANTVNLVKQGVVSVLATEDKAVGTAFFINTEGYLITNAHVIDQYDKIQLRLSDGRLTDCKIIIKDPSKDLALLKSSVVNTPVLWLDNSGLPRDGENVFTIGSPIGLEFTISNGIVSSTRIKEGINYIQTTVPVNPGNSGGPLFNSRGVVIGMVTKKVIDAENIAFAIPSSDVIAFASQNKVNYTAILGVEKNGVSSQPPVQQQEVTPPAGKPDQKEQAPAQKTAGLPWWGYTIIACVIIIALASLLIYLLFKRKNSKHNDNLPIIYSTTNQAAPNTYDRPVPQRSSRDDDLSDIDIELK